MRVKGEPLRKYKFGDEIVKRFINKKKDATKASAFIRDLRAVTIQP